MVLRERLKKLQQEISLQKLDAVLISKVANIIYLTNYAGFSTEEREVFLFITPKSQFILTDGRYTGAVKKLIPHFELVEISGKRKLKEVLRNLAQKLKINKLGIEENDLRVNEFKLAKKVIKNLKDFKFHEHRAVKTPEEIKLIEKACEIGDKTFEFILTKIKSGISEKELRYFLENFIREQGFEPSFKTIVAFGENSAVPHHLTGDRKLQFGDFVLLDFGVKFKNYCSDMTRTLVFGQSSEKQKQAYEVVKQSQQKVVECLQKKFKSRGSPIKSGMTQVVVRAADLDKIARNHILKSGFPSIPHSLGHGIGIEVHEHPYLSSNSKEALKEGMVFSIEPGIYIPDFGGVRIEDLFVIEKEGVRQLTQSNKEFIEL